MRSTRGFDLTYLNVCNSHASGRGTNSVHFLHIMEPQSRQWWRRLRMLNLPPQSGQNGTSWSFTHDTTDFSSAEKTKKHSSHILTYYLSGTEHIFEILFTYILFVLHPCWFCQRRLAENEKQK